METVIPRWEWRTFGAGFSGAGNPFATLEPGGIQESDELYLLSPLSDVNVKVRDRLMDIKRLEQVNSDRLEQWKPVMKRAFPLAAAEAGRVLAILGMVPPALARADYTIDQFVAELVRPDGRLRAVEVHKTRTRYKVEGCLAELADVVAEGRTTCTIAIESESPSRVIAALRTLGLDRHENVNYPRGLKSLVGMIG
ncbi:hypothetical protein [Accumulibacter sp.]|uniref:hypothetical protein n=1 Tax=Accumulibacter sp. TaxID=2053492 RepID=UPI0025D6F50D|nr:hypothetical protein [Accumulibacter sp.]MCM8594764.1 hypothetical protein [Accumulibacter sp.]MDS4048910.1 hypothetical protein [Accumulibacter sp.]